MTKCCWINSEDYDREAAIYQPCKKMKGNYHQFPEKRRSSYKVAITSSYYVNDRGGMIRVEKCPFCGETLFNTEFITNDIKNFDHYQIRNIDKSGCGSFFYFRVPAGSPAVEIEKECLSLILQEVGRDKKRMEDNRFSVLPAVSLFSDRIMDVVEMDFGPYGLTTKRGGNKFAVDRYGNFRCTRVVK